MDSIFVFLQNSDVETLTSNMMVFGDGAFESYTEIDEVMKVEPWSDGTGALTRRDARKLAHLCSCMHIFSLSTHTHRKNEPFEHLNS